MPASLGTEPGHAQGASPYHGGMWVSSPTFLEHLPERVIRLQNTEFRSHMSWYINNAEYNIYMYINELIVYFIQKITLQQKPLGLDSRGQMLYHYLASFLPTVIHFCGISSPPEQDLPAPSVSPSFSSPFFRDFVWGLCYQITGISGLLSSYLSLISLFVSSVESHIILKKKCWLVNRKGDHFPQSTCAFLTPHFENA